MNVDRGYVKKQAEALIDKYTLTVPVKVFQLADLMGVQWKTCTPLILKKELIKSHPKTKDHVDSWDSVLGFYDVNKKCVLLNEIDQPITRQRFTMAHEIGHIVLHDSTLDPMHTIHLRSDLIQPRDTKEAEANYFAGYLLVPDQALEEKLKFTEVLSGADTIVKSFSKMFAVSDESLRVRLKTFKTDFPDVWNEYNLSAKIF
ncbi:ImmA/IrrE family metallo-endopeptidase [Candidatus Woesebacteria bacterium]|nr:ImmA/IrrE family metallo-endopeptidase [Candidatus Woesebacteria bacterium]